MYQFKLLLIVLSVIVNITYGTPATSNVRRETVTLKGLGSVIGVTDFSREHKEFYSFTGIKYAEAPVGDYRFKAPSPVKPWHEPFDATEPGILCPQEQVFVEHNEIGIAEDCLHLSVYTRSLKASAKLPVLVYLHGGGWVSGGASEHPPHYYMDEDIVLVVPQYRLGVLGFLSFESVDVPGNAGFLDMILALKWVKKHIESFGGNPEQVTLAGQGSGASSALLLIQSPLVNNTLFHRVIAQSGASLGTWILDKTPRLNARAYADKTDCRAGDEKDFKIINCLRKAKSSYLVASYNKYKTNNPGRGNGGLGGNVVTIGGPSRFLEISPLAKFSSSKFIDIPVLAGVTQEEGKLIMENLHQYLYNLYTNWKGNNFAVLDQMYHALGLLNDDNSGIAAELIPYSMFSKDALVNGTFQDLVPGLTDVMGLLMIKAPLLREMQIRARYGTGKVYLYSLEHEGQYTRLEHSKAVSHSDDNIYLFPFPSEVAKLNEEDTKVSKTMIQLWTSFVKTGRPSSQHAPAWEPFNGNLGPYLIIDDESSVATDFLEEFGASSKLSESNLSSSLHIISFANLILVGVIMWLTK